MSGRRNIEADFNVLIDLSVEMINAQAAAPRTDGDEWIVDFQPLATKLFKQLCSARRLLEPATFISSRNQVFQFVDHSAAIVVIRACIESFVAMHWIFGSADVELRRFRHKVWTLAGLLDRLGLHPTTDEARVKVADTKLQVSGLLAEIEASPYLKSEYTAKQQKKILEGDWRVGWSWTDQAVLAGFHRKYFSSIYSHYCGYAHSSYISALQVRDSSDSIDDQYMLAQTALQTGVHVLAHFLFFYASILDAPRRVFEASESAYRIAGIWHFSAEEMDYLYDEQQKGADPEGKGASCDAGS